jgi:hypothetical protein
METVITAILDTSVSSTYSVRVIPDKKGASLMADPNPVPNTAGGKPARKSSSRSTSARRLYAVLGVAGLVLTVLQVAVLMTNTDGHEPMWLKVIIVCFNLLTAPVFALSRTRTPRCLREYDSSAR